MDIPRLYSAKAQASSFLSSNGNAYNENYHPNYVLDDNPKTAWVEGKDGDGENELIQLPISPLSSANSVTLQIRNGYQKSIGLFHANGAPNKVLISILHKQTVVTTKKVELKKEMGWQPIEIDIPADSAIDGIELKIQSVHSGYRYKDTCISDIQVFVDSEVPYNHAAESWKKEQLDLWLSERLEATKYFANQPIDYPFAKTNFQVKSRYFERIAEEDIGKAKQSDPLFLSFMKYKMALQKTSIWYEQGTVKQIKRFPDGLDLSDVLLPFFTPENLILFEGKNHKRERKGEHPSYMYDDLDYDITYQSLMSNTKVLRDDKGKIQAIYFNEQVIEQGRSLATISRDWVIVYNEKQRPQTVYFSNLAFDEPNMFSDVVITDLRPLEINYIEAHHFQYNDDGKVVNIEKSELFFEGANRKYGLHSPTDM